MIVCPDCSGAVSAALTCSDCSWQGRYRDGVPVLMSDAAMADAVRPTGPFDPELPVLAFVRPDGRPEAVLFNHSTHTIGTVGGAIRSPSFYGLAAQELEKERGGTFVFFEGASGSTHNIDVSTPEALLRIKNAVADALQRAWDILTSRAARDAFDLDSEPAAVRDRYGFQPAFDPGAADRCGAPAWSQRILLARRLVEAGVRLVTVDLRWWDTHVLGFESLRLGFLPRFDQAYTALIEDLD